MPDDNEVFKGHGWRFMDASGLVHGGSMHLIRIVYQCEDDKDQFIGYDGLSAQGRKCFHVEGDAEYAEGYELGMRLTTGLYVTLDAGCMATVVFDPIEAV